MAELPTPETPRQACGVGRGDVDAPPAGFSAYRALALRQRKRKDATTTTPAPHNGRGSRWH